MAGILEYQFESRWKTLNFETIREFFRLTIALVQSNQTKLVPISHYQLLFEKP